MLHPDITEVTKIKQEQELSELCFSLGELNILGKKYYVEDVKFKMIGDVIEKVKRYNPTYIIDSNNVNIHIKFECDLQMTPDEYKNFIKIKND